MTIFSSGYDGTVDEVQWAQLVPAVGAAQYGVVGAGDWKVTSHPVLDKAVLVAAGSGWGPGVFDTSDAPATVQCDALTSGTRWDLITAKRDWQPTAGATVFSKVTGGAVKTLPARFTDPGEQDEQPLALVQWTAGQTQPTAIVDLRCWAGNGGMFAKEDLVRSYLDRLGASINIAGLLWSYQVGANDTPGWILAGPTTYAPLPVNGYSLTGAIKTEPAGAGRRVTVDINVKRTGPAGQIPDSAFASFGAVIPAAARGDSVNTKYVPVSISGGTTNAHATAALDTDTGVLSIRGLADFTFTKDALFTLNLAYYI
jgi:hypothetical protein